ncbi:MAG: 50S ribosomal protein L32 [Candidatus Omnitrophica bacterium]|nr:50S ribosomal protein L32 [Candidatus Omnitrophota bacterium]
MPLPKRRHSKTRGRKRRTHWKLKSPVFVACSQCKQLKLPHHVCSFCGYYNGKQVIQIKEKTKKTKR